MFTDEELAVPFSEPYQKDDESNGHGRRRLTEVSHSVYEGNEKSIFQDYRSGWALLTLSAISAGFGNSLEPVSMLAFLQTIFLIMGLCVSMKHNSLRSWQFIYVVFYVLVSQALGFCLGYSSIFGYPTQSALTVFTSFLAGFFAWIVYCLLAVIPHIFIMRKFPLSWVLPFAYPVTHTFVTCTVIGSFFSTFPALGNAVIDYSPLAQVSTLIGIAGINFIATYIGTNIALLILNEKVLRFKNRAINVGVSCVLLFVITGFIFQSQSLYQVNVSKEIRDMVSVSCVFAQTAEVNSADWYQVWNSTEQRVLAGDSIVMMAEESLKITTDDEEDQVIAKATALAQRGTAVETLVGVSFLKQVQGAEYATNQFVLVSSTGQTLWNYFKAHPVPLIESNVRAGSGQLPFASTSYGKLSGAICFDLDFPQYIASAGRNEVDILLQPSWTWNAINFRHFNGDSLRAIENGFTLFRCSSDGESGIVDPKGRFLARQYTGHDPSNISVFQLPLQPRINTFFSYVGFIFEYLVVAAASIIILVAYLPKTAVKGVLSLVGAKSIQRTMTVKNMDSVDRFDDNESYATIT